MGTLYYDFARGIDIRPVEADVYKRQIQGVGYTNLAMLSGVSEMIARILVSLLAVPAFGYLAVCFGDPTAWIFADAFLIPAFIYVYRRILRMKKN